MKRQFLLLFLLGTFTVNYAADIKVMHDPCEYPRRVTIERAHLLIQVLEDEKIGPNLKQCTLDRITKFYSTQKEEPKFSREVISAIQKMNQQESAKTSGKSIALRQASCRVLGSLENSSVKGEAISALKAIVREENNNSVTASCITVLANFKTEKQGIADFFIELVNAGLEKEDINVEDIRRMNLLVTSLGRLGQQNAYAPLIRVLQSGYPENVKIAAKRALQDLQLVVEEESK